MAANGYVIVLPNRRGLPGFGSAWNEEISGDWTGQCMNDYLSAIDDAAKNLPYVDKDRLGCVGASFGGFSVYYLAGHHNKRFKAFLAAGTFRLWQPTVMSSYCLTAVVSLVSAVPGTRRFQATGRVSA